MKIICVGMNYAEHTTKELNCELPKEPVIFMKSDSSLLKSNKPFYLPYFSEKIEYETEIVYHISRLGKNIQEKFASRYYDSIALGLDLTARDLQRKLRAEGKPWEISKAFDGSAVISEFVPLAEIENKESIEFSLEIDGETRQKGNTKDMIFPIDRIIAYVSQFFTLKIGDLIYTGTPKGVGRLTAGTNLVGKIGDKKMFDFNVK